MKILDLDGTAKNKIQRSHVTQQCHVHGVLARTLSKLLFLGRRRNDLKYRDVAPLRISKSYVFLLLLFSMVYFGFSDALLVSLKDTVLHNVPRLEKHKFRTRTVCNVR